MAGVSFRSLGAAAEEAGMEMIFGGPLWRGRGGSPREAPTAAETDTDGVLGGPFWRGKHGIAGALGRRRRRPRRKRMEYLAGHSVVEGEALRESHAAEEAETGTD